MNNFSYEGLTHDSGKESYAQAASKKPFTTIANGVCDKIKSGQYDEFSRCDDYGILYLTAVSVPIPEGMTLNFEGVDIDINRSLQENSLSHYQYGGMVCPTEDDEEITIYLEDDRRPSKSWAEEKENEDGQDAPNNPALDILVNVICTRLTRGNYDLLAYQDEQAFGYWLLLQVELDIPGSVYRMLLNMTSEDELKKAIEKKLNSLNETHLYYIGDTPANYCRGERDLEHSPVAYFRDDRLAHLITEENYEKPILHILTDTIYKAVRYKKYQLIDNDAYYCDWEDGTRLYLADLDIAQPMYLAMRRRVDVGEIISEVNRRLEGETSLRYYGDSLYNGEEPTSAKALFYDNGAAETTENKEQVDYDDLPF